MTLDLPASTIAAKQVRTDLESAVKDAFIEMEHHLEECRAGVQRKRFWKRFAEREDRGDASVPPPEQRKRDEFS